MRERTLTAPRMPKPSSISPQMAAQQYAHDRSVVLVPRLEARTQAKQVELDNVSIGEAAVKTWTYIIPRLMRPHTAILSWRDRVRFHTTAMGSNVHTTSARTDAARLGQSLQARVMQ